MNVKDSLEYFSRKIIKNGEINLDNIGTLTPSDYFDSFKKLESSAPNVPEYYKHSDVLINEFGATHYTVEWKEFPNMALLKLYKAEALGACDVKQQNLIKEILVNVY